MSACDFLDEAFSEQQDVEAFSEQQFFDRLQKNAQRMGHVLQRGRTGYLLYPAQGSTLHLGDLDTVRSVLRHIKIEQRQEPKALPATSSLAGWLG